MSLLFRPGTWDKNIWQAVFDGNEYQLPERFQKEDVILDLGAHIGSFTYTALDRSAGLVVAVEPDPDNIRVWRHNLHGVCQAQHRAVLITAAACGQQEGGHVPARYAPVAVNTGGGNTMGATGLPVVAIPFDALVDLASALSAKGRVRLCKLDIEGAEWPCLLSSQRLDLLEEIVAEYHLIDGWAGALASLERLLAQAGFAVLIQPDQKTTRLGKFWARR